MLELLGKWEVGFECFHGILLKFIRYSSNGTSFPFESNVEGEVVGSGLVR